MPAPRTRRSWHGWDVWRLRKLCLTDLTLREIALEMSRRYDAVRNKVRELGIKRLRHREHEVNAVETLLSILSSGGEGFEIDETTLTVEAHRRNPAVFAMPGRPDLPSDKRVNSELCKLIKRGLVVRVAPRRHAVLPAGIAWLAGRRGRVA